MKTVYTEIGDERTPRPSQCWCCGTICTPTELVHLGDHPEVVVCTRCAHSLSKWAWEIEDRGHHGPAARARNSFRRLRRSVIRHGWQHNKFVGRGLRWIGRFTP